MTATPLTLVNIYGGPLCGHDGVAVSTESPPPHLDLTVPGDAASGRPKTTVRYHFSTALTESIGRVTYSAKQPD